MPHQVEDVSGHHQGDALDMTASVVKDEDSNTPKDITGASAEWLLLETASDKDSNALLTKTTDSGGITILDAANGKLEISIETGDTSSLNGTKHHRLRVTDSDGDRITVFVGSFTIEY